MKIILGSGSPRRRELLTQIGVNFEVRTAQGEECCAEENPEKRVAALAKQKAEEVAQSVYRELKEKGELPALVIGADTLVAYENHVLGKPADEADAYRMLSMLQGNTHQVYTGVCVITLTEEDGKDYEKDYEKAYVGDKVFHEESKQSFFEQTNVTMYPMAEQEIRDYIATKDPMDKAGSYGIQGICAKYIEKIDGDYNNVVGLPIGALWQKCLRNACEQL